MHTSWGLDGKHEKVFLLSLSKNLDSETSPVIIGREHLQTDFGTLLII